MNARTMITNAIRKLNVSTLLDHTTVLANLDLKATDITADVSVTSYLNTFQGHNVSFGSFLIIKSCTWQTEQKTGNRRLKKPGD